MSFRIMFTAWAVALLATAYTTVRWLLWPEGSS